jgi:hypothetical protein
MLYTVDEVVQPSPIRISTELRPSSPVFLIEDMVKEDRFSIILEAAGKYGLHMSKRRSLNGARR